MKEYGTPDADTAVYDVLREYIAYSDVQYIMHYPRKPIDAKPCQLPQSLTVVAVFANGRTVQAFQAAPGHRVTLKEV